VKSTPKVRAAVRPPLFSSAGGEARP